MNLENPMTTLLTARTFDGKLIGRCDQRCYNAGASNCTCICRGINHGVGRFQAATNSLQPLPLHITDQLSRHTKQPVTITPNPAIVKFTHPTLFPMSR